MRVERLGSALVVVAACHQYKPSYPSDFTPQERWAMDTALGTASVDFSCPLEEIHLDVLKRWQPVPYNTYVRFHASGCGGLATYVCMVPVAVCVHDHDASAAP